MNLNGKSSFLFYFTVLLLLLNSQLSNSQPLSNQRISHLNINSLDKHSRQSDILLDLFHQISPDSLNLYVRQLSGDTLVWLNGAIDSIKTRYAKSEGIIKAQNYLFAKLLSWGYDVELQPFRLAPNFGDILFAPNDPNFGWFYIDGKIFATQNSGETWQEQKLDFLLTDIKNFEAVNEEVIYAVGYYPILLKTTDGGNHWQKLNPPFNRSIYGVSFVNENLGWICGNYGNIYRTEDGGSSWTKQPTPVEYGIYAIDVADSLHGCAVGNLGTVLRTEDGGLNWEKIDIHSDATLVTVRFSPGGDFWAMGTGGILMRSKDLGKNWEFVSIGVNTTWWDIDFADSLRGVLVGQEGKIYLTGDGGSSWHAVSDLTRGNCYYVDINSAGDIWITGKDVFLHSADWFEHYKDFSDNFTNTTLNNVIATKYGSLQPDTSVIICAHYDDYSEAENRMTLAPGADDNASGSAAVLEAARVLADKECGYTTKFVLFSGEELGLLGSEYFAENAVSNNQNILSAINLDMIGYDGNNDGRLQIHAAQVANSPEIANAIVQTAQQFMFPLLPEIISDNPTNRSDQASFWQNGFGAVLIIEDLMDFNPFYHSINDLFSNFNQNYFYYLANLSIMNFAQLANILPSSVVAQEDQVIVPENIYLSPAYPNPFNNVTRFDFDLQDNSQVTVEIYSLDGTKVSNYDLKEMARGHHHFIWRPGHLASGVYFLKFNFAKQKFLRKVILMK